MANIIAWAARNLFHLRWNCSFRCLVHCNGDEITIVTVDWTKRVIIAIICKTVQDIFLSNIISLILAHERISKYCFISAYFPLIFRVRRKLPSWFRSKIRDRNLYKSSTADEIPGDERTHDFFIFIFNRISIHLPDSSFYMQSTKFAIIVNYVRNTVLSLFASLFLSPSFLKKSHLRSIRANVRE